MNGAVVVVVVVVVASTARRASSVAPRSTPHVPQQRGIGTMTTTRTTTRVIASLLAITNTNATPYPEQGVEL